MFEKIIQKVLEVGGVNVLPFLVVTYVYYKHMQEFLDWQKARLDEQREVLKQNQKVISDFTNAINDLEDQVDEEH